MSDVNGNHVCTCVRTYVYIRIYVRPRPTARLRMRERCSNSADLAGFAAVCFWSRKCPKQVIDINRNPKIEMPRLRKRQHSASGSVSQLSPREATRWL